MAMRQMMPGRQTACMCVSVDSSHENCSYHSHKYSCKFNGIQRPFFFYMNLQVVFGGGGSTYIRVQLIFGKIRYVSLLGYLSSVYWTRIREDCVHITTLTRSPTLTFSSTTSTRPCTTLSLTLPSCLISDSS